jgi:hypothetical protein
MKRYHARNAVIQALKDKGLYVGAEDNPMALSFCSKSGDIIEPLMKPQWWVKVQPMADKALAVSPHCASADLIVRELIRYLLILSVREQANSPLDLQHARMNGIDGLKIPTTGVYLVSYGGVTDALPISFSWKAKVPKHQAVATISGSLRGRRRRRRSGHESYMATRSSHCIKMRMSLTHGSHLDFGHSRLSAGPTRCVHSL